MLGYCHYSMETPWVHRPAANMLTNQLQSTNVCIKTGK